VQAGKIIRSIDFRGRIVIPKKVRDAMRIMTYDRLEVIVLDDGLLIRKLKDESGRATNGKKL
jgi:AbrB family looped-hinge helix DNA binding protein